MVPSLLRSNIPQAYVPGRTACGRPARRKLSRLIEAPSGGNRQAGTGRKASKGGLVAGHKSVPPS